MIRIVIVVDNSAEEPLKNVHGLSIFVEANDKYILFDTGPSPDILEYNADKAGIDIDLVDAVVISHTHSAHIGGLPYLGWSSPYLTTYIPYGSMETLGRRIRSEGLKPIEVTNWTRLDRDIYVSRPFNGPPWEHFLVLRSPRGLVVLSGCMHPGAHRVLDEISRYLSERICCVIGGFHLHNAIPKAIANTVDYLSRIKPDIIVPLHCSGDVFRQMLAEKMPESIKLLKAGQELIIP